MNTQALCRLSWSLCLSVLLCTGFAQSRPDTLYLLLIGNSFSQNATRYLPQLAMEGGHVLIIGRAELGGCSFERHWRITEAAEANPGAPEGRMYKEKSLKMILSEKPWNIVTIQQNSLNSTDFETYMPYAKKLCDYVKSIRPKAEVVIHQTWAYRSDSKDFGRISKTDSAKNQKEMWEASKTAYRRLSKELGIRIIPVGDAFWQVDSDKKWGYEKNQTFDWNQPVQPALPTQIHSLHRGYFWTQAGKLGFDSHHANEAGCYLAGLVWYKFLFGESPKKLKFKPEEVSEKFAKHLKNIAVQSYPSGEVPLFSTLTPPYLCRLTPIKVIPMSEQYTKEEKYGHVRRWQTSGQRQIDYCWQSGLSLDQFRRWRSAYLKEHPLEKPATGIFYPVEVTVPPCMQSGDSIEVTIRYPHGVTLHLQGGVA